MSGSAQTPLYHGLTKHVDREGGYSLWLPNDWLRLEMLGDRQGAIYTPYADRHDTCLSAEKRKLEYPVRPKDINTLRKGFAEGLSGLPGVEIEWQDESITSSVSVFEAVFTFLDDGQRRKRWTRVVYWGNGQLILIAQGATPEEFEHWRPMIYNTMMTIEM